MINVQNNNAFYLVGCTSTKANSPQPPRDLYRGKTFLASRQWLEVNNHQWLIISAKGVFDPADQTPLYPYDYHLESLTHAQETQWRQNFVATLMRYQVTTYQGVYLLMAPFYATKTAAALAEFKLPIFKPAEIVKMADDQGLCDLAMAYLN